MPRKAKQCSTCSNDTYVFVLFWRRHCALPSCPPCRATKPPQKTLQKQKSGSEPLLAACGFLFSWVLGFHEYTVPSLWIHRVFSDLASPWVVGFLRSNIPTPANRITAPWQQSDKQQEQQEQQQQTTTRSSSRTRSTRTRTREQSLDTGVGFPSLGLWMWSQE